MFASARQAEIIRSNQKDQYYSGSIKGSIADIIQSLFGPSTWIKWRQELDFVADLGYFGLTTLAGFQTLGEEYVSIVQVDSTGRAVPSSLRRVMMILLQVGAPYALHKCLSHTERQLRQNRDIQLDTETRTKLLNIIPVIRHSITIVHRCHLAMFYMKGLFYHISKRLTSVNYILVRSTRSDVEGAASNYSILGWLSILQLAFTFVQQLYRSSRLRNVRAPGVSDFEVTASSAASAAGLSQAGEGAVVPGQKCSLCLEPRSHSTATPCGHLFCWSCIAEWGATKLECPLCREPFQMSRLICLQNYDPR